MLFAHVRVLQKSSVPAQSAGARHPTHWPCALQTPLVPQGWVALATCLGVPASQLSVVHGLLSSFTSRSSLITLTAPLPSQTFFLQSPAVCVEVAVPSLA